MSSSPPSSAASSSPPPFPLSLLSSPSSPCTRQPLLWGVTVSSLLILHQFNLVRKGRQTWARAVDVGVFSFLGTAGIQFGVCRVNEREKRNKIKLLMKAAGVKEAGKEA
ncbi:hypothetical protein TrVE_jg2623 [Triparma verrucosa]|uniref:Cytochrome c oxidase assembly protein COX20, mitochondrial n=2 Tax=Triparma TaxID=722752 RepID=A0A9W7BP80_9STRA|nr:hypothetical protein TrVE_jg2623 [Triparma verrucosa]GMH90864.1 hypothetical protein TrST_g3896 [Triparma strigata]|mmetsp:Transcript_1470/g.2571  ORF Transcript_1470/g.2571 Transcript_1470/m.2571 type:complete len:109 (-) Transcript_1470:24-350(-)